MMILEQLKHNLDALELSEGVGTEVFLQRPTQRAWSAHEQLAHLGRYQEVFLERLEYILTADAPVFEKYNAETDQGFLQWTALSTTDVIQELRRTREHMLRRLEPLTEADFARVGVHPRYGELSLTHWLQFFLIHESHHLSVALSQAAAPQR